ncbi:MAG: CPBP family intramembrane glutamic endopeptidase [Promethearchaeota archaeon]
MNTINEIFSKRMVLFVEIFLLLLVNFFLSLIPFLFLPSLLPSDSVFYGIFFYLTRLVLFLIAIPLSLYISKLLIKPIENEKLSPPPHLKELFTFSRSNFTTQVYHGILLLFLIFIPLDFLTYLFLPNMIEYIGRVLIANQTNRYIMFDDYFLFLFAVVIIQLSLALQEETFARGFITIRGAHHVKKMSALMISAWYFGFGHFAYFFSPISREYPTWYPFLWFAQAFFIAIILSSYILKKKWIFPLIFAHGCNNIISAHVLWNYFNGYPFERMVLFLYIPLLCVSGILYVARYTAIKKGIELVWYNFKAYIKEEKQLEKSKSYLILTILLDLLFALAIFGINIIL